MGLGLASRSTWFVYDREHPTFLSCSRQKHPPNPERWLLLLSPGMSALL
jgi:hypothetical protein